MQSVSYDTVVSELSSPRESEGAPAADYFYNLNREKRKWELSEKWVSHGIGVGWGRIEMINGKYGSYSHNKYFIGISRLRLSVLLDPTQLAVLIN